MRVATYTDSTVPGQGTHGALIVLVLTILLGTGVVPTVAAFAGGALPMLVTPLWLLLYIGAFVGLMFTYGINWLSWIVRYRILLVLLLLGAVVSVSWSIDAHVSAERVVHLLGSSLIAIYIGFTLPLLLTLRVFSIALVAMVLASIVAAVVLPTLGIENYEGQPVWRGVFNSKNDLGFWAAVGVLLYVTLSDSVNTVFVKALCMTMAVVCLGTLYMSHSATSLVAMLLAGSLSLYLYIASRFQLGFFRMLVIAALFVALTGLAIANIETSELVGRSGDLTGRGEVWRQVINLIGNYPLTGVGYGALWFPTDDTLWIQQSLFDFTWIVYHAHNGLLQVASEIGTPLAVIALLMVIQQLIEIFYCQYERQQVGVLFVLAFTVAFLISNFAEARFLITRELFWIFFLALPISMLRQINLIGNTQISEQPPEDSIYADAFGNGTQPETVPPMRSAHMPWLQPAVAGAGALLPASAAYAREVYGEAYGNASSEFASDEELDERLSTLSLSETDIDLGGLYEVQELVTEEDSVSQDGIDNEQQALVETANKRSNWSSSKVVDVFDNQDRGQKTSIADRKTKRVVVDIDLKGEVVDIDLND